MAERVAEPEAERVAESQAERVEEPAAEPEPDALAREIAEARAQDQGDFQIRWLGILALFFFGGDDCKSRALFWSELRNSWRANSWQLLRWHDGGSKRGKPMVI